MTEVVQHLSSEANISLSDSARRQLVTWLHKEMLYKGARLSVKKTGCSGLSYVVDYVREIQATDLSLVLDEHYHVYIDRASYPFLKGLYMDYITQGLNSKFVFSNPNQTGQCGCGESFTISE